jgi:hypothetical protein
MSRDVLGQVGRYELEQRLRRAEAKLIDLGAGWRCSACDAFNGVDKERCTYCERKETP